MVMSDDAIELVLQKWAWAKGEEAAMKKTIEMCKTQEPAIAKEKALKERGSMEIITDNYEVKKRKTEHVSKKDLPAAIWSKYAKTSEFSVLAFKSKKAMKGGKPKAAPKAKAKAKAKSSAKTMKSNK